MKIVPTKVCKNCKLELPILNFRLTPTKNARLHTCMDCQSVILNMPSKFTSYEFQEQVALFQWAEYHPICKDHLIAIPNGGRRDPKEAMSLKRQGVKSGVSDIFLAYPLLPMFGGLWIEMKRPRLHRSQVSKNQLSWLDRMSKCGYMSKVAYGCSEAIKFIEDYLDCKNKAHGSTMMAYPLG